MAADDSVNDLHDLARFERAQEEDFQTALSEIRRGRKRTHWIWYIFPQVDGLGSSSTSRHYAIRSVAEARAYLEHPVLGPRLHECATALIALQDRSVEDIFGYPDYLKLRSSMTLFAAVSGPGSVFSRVLERYFGGQPDPRTVEWLAKHPR